MYADVEENIFKQDFAVSDTVMAAIIENQSVEISQVSIDEIQIDKYEYCKRIAERVEDDDVVTDDLVLFVDKLEKNNSHLTFVNELKNNVNDILDRILFYDMCYDNFNKDGEGFSDIGTTLEEMENLDEAFERRFLFKIRFDKPTTEAKKNIWMNKLPSLSLVDAETLASNYEFSSGQIDNVVRKALMQEAIKGDKPTTNSLIELCSEEKITKNNYKHIGFC